MNSIRYDPIRLADSSSRSSVKNSLIRFSFNLLELEYSRKFTSSVRAFSMERMFKHLPLKLFLTNSFFPIKWFAVIMHESYNFNFIYIPTLSRYLLTAAIIFEASSRFIFASFLVIPDSIS